MNVRIADTAFSLNEAAVAIKQAEEDKAPRDDKTMPVVLKRFNIDAIILHFANKMVLENKTREQYSGLNNVPYSQIWRPRHHCQLPWYRFDTPPSGHTSVKLSLKKRFFMALYNR